jgi:hypothetical protein
LRIGFPRFFYLEKFRQIFNWKGKQKFRCGAPVGAAPEGIMAAQVIGVIPDDTIA